MSCKFRFATLFFIKMFTSLSNASIQYDRIAPDTLSHQDVVALFLHEALGSVAQWKSFPSDVCNALQMEGLIYERSGHGGSSPLEQQRNANYLHDYALRELPAFLEEINEDRKILLVGHSDGGTIALLFAAKFPERVAGVVTMAAHVINEPETIRGIQPAIAAFEAGKLDGLRKYHGDKTDALFYAWANIWRDASFQNWDITQEIAAPTLNGLFLQGADDQYGTARQLELIEDHFKGDCEAALIENCGHHPHLEQGAVVIEKIHDWWSE